MTTKDEDKNWIEKALDEKARFTPDHGYNVVGVDTFEAPGEALYLVGHFDTLEEAERVRDEHARGAPFDRFYVYSPEDH